MSDQTKGVKHDQGKARMDLLSSYWIDGVARVLSYGEKKYAAHNWRSGIAQSRLLGAALRHVFAFLGGEDLDPETGLSHLSHASCCLMFASELLSTHPHLDDRYKIPARVEEGRVRTYDCESGVGGTGNMCYNCGVYKKAIGSFCEVCREAMYEGTL